MGQMFPGENVTSRLPLKVFITSVSVMGDMMSFPSPGMVIVPACMGNGLANANCICNQLAANQGLTANGAIFNAWLSDASTDALCNIVGRMGMTAATNCGNYFPGKTTYVDMHNNTLFASWTDIMQGVLPSININVMENGVVMTSAMFSVWTGTTNGGVYSGSDCTTGGTTASWTDVSAAMGSVGDFSVISGWTQSLTGTMTCGGVYPIYCFEQP